MCPGLVTQFVQSFFWWKKSNFEVGLCMYYMFPDHIFPDHILPTNEMSSRGTVSLIIITFVPL